MTTILEFAAMCIVSVTVIVNPASTSAVFIALTEEMSRKEKILIARRAVKIAAAILVIFAVSGMMIFQIFGISLGAFQIAGGIILLTLGIGMVFPKESKEEAKQVSKDIAIIPLAIPFSAGPGTITTVVVLMSQASAQSGNFIGALPYYVMVFLGIAIAMALSYLGMKYSEKIDDVLKEGGRAVMSRLMGLIVMAIAVQFVINGIISVIPDIQTSIGG